MISEPCCGRRFPKHFYLPVNFSCNKSGYLPVNFSCNKSGYLPVNFSCNKSGYLPVNFSCNKSGYLPVNFSCNKSGYLPVNFSCNKSGYNRFFTPAPEKKSHVVKLHYTRKHNHHVIRTLYNFIFHCFVVEIFPCQWAPVNHVN